MHTGESVVLDLVGVGAHDCVVSMMAYTSYILPLVEHGAFESQLLSCLMRYYYLFIYMIAYGQVLCRAVSVGLTRL